MAIAVLCYTWDTRQKVAFPVLDAERGARQNIFGNFGLRQNIFWRFCTLGEIHQRQMDLSPETNGDKLLTGDKWRQKETNQNHLSLFVSICLP